MYKVWDQSSARMEGIGLSPGLSMSFTAKLIDLERNGKPSLTAQIVEVISEAISSGELAPGDQVPSTRELAELASVNQLTAIRAYRQLRERGLVTAQVGRGTFVRETAQAAETTNPEATEWQVYALPERLETAQDRAVSELTRHSAAPGTIPLSVGHPATGLLPAREVRDTLDRVLDELGPSVLQYAQTEGEPQLRAALARHAAERGSPETAANVLVTSGARQALSLIARAVIKPGEVAACESPSFVGSIDALRAAGATVRPLPVDEEGVDVGALEQLLQRHDVKLLFLQSRVQNPTGASLSERRADALIELARRYSFFVVDDEVWAELASKGADRPGLRSRDHGHVISVGSFSKVLGGGLRLGWILGSGPILQHLSVGKRNDDTHTAVLIQLAIARLLEEGGLEEPLRRIRAALNERAELFLRALEEHLAPLATWTEPSGANVWVTLGERIDEHRLYAEAVRKGVTFVPGSAMMPGRPPRTQLRLSFGYVEPDQLEAGVKRLAGAIEEVRAETHVTIPVS